MNCREVLEKLYEYLDQELIESESKKLEQHLEYCSDCLQKYNIEKAVQEAIKNRLNDTYDTGALKARIITEIDKIDKASSGRTIFFFLAPVAAAAAIAFAFLFPIQGGGNAGKVYAAVAPFADLHTECLKKLLSFKFESSDPQVLDSCMGELEQLPHELFEYQSPDIRIAAATISDMPEGNEPMLEYIAFGDSVSLFVNKHYSIDQSPFSEVKVRDKSLLVGSCNNYRYVIWECRGTQCIAVSRLPREELINFAIAF